jgi:hypothetical protein
MSLKGGEHKKYFLIFENFLTFFLKFINKNYIIIVINIATMWKCWRRLAGGDISAF